jgi:hypothetical protein
MDLMKFPMDGDGVDQARDGCPLPNISLSPGSHSGVKILDRSQLFSSPGLQALAGMVYPVHRPQGPVAVKF